MRILVVQESDWLEKGPHQSHHLMERLSKKGHEIRVIDFEILWKSHKDKILISKREVFENVSKVIDNGNVTVIRPSIIKVPVLDYISLLYTHRKEIKRQLDDFDPDVIIGFGILNANIAIKLSRKRGIPFIYYLIDELYRLVPQTAFQPLAKYIERRNIEKSNKVLVINEKLKEYAIEMGANPDETHVVKAGIDLNRFNPENSGKEIRENYGIKKDDIVLFFMGWLYKFSGLREVSVELAKVKDKYPNIKLLFIGKGDIYNELNEVKKRLGDQIILLDWQPYEKIPKFISASDICLLPAYNIKIMRNIVPIKMYEYMAMGKPVIATELPGVMKEFGNDHGVIYVNKPEDVLKKAIELIEKGILKEHGSKARKFVEKYSWDDIVDDFEGILKELI